MDFSMEMDYIMVNGFPCIIWFSMYLYMIYVYHMFCFVNDDDMVLGIHGWPGNPLESSDPMG